MNTAFKNILIYTFGTFLIIQLIQVDITNTKTNKELEIQAPKEVMKILKSSCYDCHSNEVNIPWYSSIAPMSWTISRHIDIGRKWVNFSIWNSYTKKEKDKKLTEIYRAVYKAMPLQFYEMMHSEAKLSKQDRQLVRKWTNKAPF